jgi:hypothetical protein
MFIEFETYSEAGRTTLNVRHIVQIEKSKDGNDTTLILANGGSVLVKATRRCATVSSASSRTIRGDLRARALAGRRSIKPVPRNRAPLNQRKKSEP